MTDTQHDNIPPEAGLQPIYIKKSRGAGFWVAVGLASFFFLCTLFLFMLFIGSLVLSKALITSTATKDKKQVFETVVGGSGESKIAIIPIKGILSNESAEGLFIEKPSIVEVVKQQLEQATDDAHVKAILLEVDSPGGGITASDIIYNQITKFKAETQKKVVVYMQDIAASGGYYISSAADAIVAHPTTITGSIGVIMPLINVAELINRYGIKDNSIASGNLKEIGSPLKQMTADEAAVLKGIIDEMYMQFVKVVSTGRNLDIEEVKKIADGRIYTGKQALDKGLVDQLGYPEDAIALTKKLARLTEATIVRYEEHYGLADLFGLMSGKIFQNNTIRLDISQLQERGDTRPMYLWTGYSRGK
ncbi:MAG: signal peptide peptidase SppA [Candidatus Brocadia sp.]|nr:signal peptide peptidase SppA [Candidatus Brocadia sp.]